MTTNPQEFLSDTKVNLDKLPTLGKRLKVRANADQLEKIADAANVSAVGRFIAEVEVKRIKGGVQVLGNLSAEVTQPCVITLDPVHQPIDLTLDRVFMPKPANLAVPQERENATGSDSYIDLNGEDLPDYYVGSTLDLSDFLLESFAMAIDLYPRLPGAKMDPKQAGDDPAELSPFAVLKDLN